ncbi:DNA-binding transcriptional MocR family regulator [Lipingzhangella halophila]|uniref:DNA-binding transcriptional MocR family regulator n=1 Tax=Lipingzhangella halophila TaxID=1783352 RepID=A0A7W7RE30_9ACTN|nr:DNA-binding transcriptional MocR family regulator [Lipingzhangella halophila]
MVSSRSAGELAALLGDWPTGDGPLYVKLTEALRRTINGGTLAVGERLPSERALAAALAVSRTTVVTAYGDLRSEGLLDSVRGSGTRVSPALAPARPDGWVPGGRGHALFQGILDGSDNVISLACMRSEGLPEVADAIRDVANEDLPALMADDGYYPRGLLALRRAIAERYTAEGLSTRPDQIVVTTGAHQAIALVSSLYVRNGAPVVVESPGFGGCMEVLRAEGAEFVSIPMDQHGIDTVRLREAARERTPHLIYVMPEYHNPTGTQMTPARRREVAEIAARSGVPIVEDFAYTGLRAPEEYPPIAAYAPRGAEVVVVGSLCKTSWAGLRVGWLRAPVEIAERLARRKVLADLGTPLLDQAVAVRLLSQLDELARKRSDLLSARMAFVEERLRAALPDWEWRRPDGGSSLWIRMPDTDASVFAQVALRHGVELVPGPAMTPEHDADFSSFFRLPFGHDEETLEELVSRLARAWSDLSRHGPCEETPLQLVV